MKRTFSLLKAFPNAFPPLKILVGLCLLLIITLPAFAQQFPQYWVMDQHIGMKFYADSVKYFHYDSLIINSLDSTPGDQFHSRNLTALTIDSTRFFTAGGNEILDWEGLRVENGKLDSVDNRVNAFETNGTLLLLNEDSTKAFWINAQTAYKNYYPQLNIKQFGLKYSLVDLEANAGRGKVLEGHKEIYLTREPLEERLMAIRKPDGINWWVIAIRRKRGDFLILETDKDSLKIHDSIASPYLSHDNLPPFGMGEWDYHPGKQLIVMPGKVGTLSFFNFDPCIGQITFARTIRISNIIKEIISLEFSPNGQFLYIWAWKSQYKILQIDLTDPSANMNGVPIFSTDTVPNNTFPQYPMLPTQMQMGPNGKIYFGIYQPRVVGPNSNASIPRRCQIAVINSPDQPFPFCDVKSSVFSDTLWNLGLGFPNLPVDVPWQGIQGAAITSQPTSGCVPLTLQFGSDACGHTGQEWDFGDGSAASAQKAPQHTYTAPGTYFVSCTLTHPWAANPMVLYDTVRVEDCISVSYAAQQDTGCHHVPVQFHASLVGNAQWHQWDFGDGNTDTVQDPAHSYIQPGTYTVTYTAGNAEHTDTYTQTVTIPECGPIFQLHPNPSLSGPTLSYYLPNEVTGSYQVYDVLGKFICKASMQPGYQSHAAIPFPVAGGTYYLRAEISDGRRIVEKFVVTGE